MAERSESNSGEKLQLPEPATIASEIDQLDPIVREFMNSVESALENLEENALQIEKNGEDEESWKECRQILHNLKGEAGFVKADSLQKTLQGAESVLVDMREKNEVPTDMLLKLKDWLQDVLYGQDSDATTVTDEVSEGEFSFTETSSASELKSLVVEDDFTSRLFLQEILKEYGSCHIAVNGDEAVQAVRLALEEKDPYDLICLDIMMPEMDGQEALTEIRRQEENRGILSSNGAKILMTTALDDLQSVNSAYKNLCDAYLVKPIDKNKLLQELRNCGFSDL